MAAKIKSTVFSFIKLAGFIVSCVAASFAVIAPLWLFASKKPGLYTAACLLAVTAFAAFKAAGAAKKAGLKKTLFFCLKALCVLAAILGAFFSLANWSRLFCAASVLAGAALLEAVRRIEKKANARGA